MNQKLYNIGKVPYMAFVNGLDKVQKQIGIKHGEKYFHTVLNRPYNVNLDLSALTSEIKNQDKSH